MNMDVVAVAQVMRCDWYETKASRIELEMMFEDITFPEGVSMNGWYLGKSDTVLIIGDDVTNLYVVFVWNNINAKNDVRKHVDDLVAVINVIMNMGK